MGANVLWFVYRYLGGCLSLYIRCFLSFYKRVDYSNVQLYIQGFHHQVLGLMLV